MKRIPHQDLQDVFVNVLLKLGFAENKALICAEIFTGNSLDGIYSHGVNRFPVFVQYVQERLIDIHAEPKAIEKGNCFEIWDGGYGPGMYNAKLAMERTINMATQNNIGCVVMKNTNHWMRGGTYGLQAADAGCIGICFSNTIANMPAWGGKEPRLGNNPLVIAVPRTQGHIVLDMAMSQFSYGKLQESFLKNAVLSVPGGYDEQGNLTQNPGAILQSWRALPIGFWKGSGLSFVMDIVLTAISGGNSVARITSTGKETGLTQIFLCLHRSHYEQQLIEEIISYSKSGEKIKPDRNVLFPGERMLETRRKNMAEGIPVEQEVWKTILLL